MKPLNLIHWIRDYVHFARGGVLMYFHASPPEHYLGYVVEGKTPLIFLPGVLNRWAFMKPMADVFSREGHPIYIVPELKDNLFDVPASAEKVRELLDKENIRDIIIVAHSKGGLVGKQLLAFHNDDNRIKGMVAIATPFSGSSLAKIIPHRAFRELRPGSDTIRTLHAKGSINKKIISIMPLFDNHVWVEKGSYLEGAKDNIRANVNGHHKIIFDNSVIDLVRKSIERLAAD